MAFVQVVRRSMRPEEYTDLRAGWLKRFLYESKYEITDIEITDARQTGENTYEYYPGGYRRLKKGGGGDHCKGQWGLCGRHGSKP